MKYLLCITRLWNLIVFQNLSDSNTFITLFNQVLRRIHIQFNNSIYIISILKKAFGKHLNIFQLSVDNADNFIKVLSLHWGGAVHSNLVFVIYFFFVFWFVSLQAGYYITVTHLFRFYVPLLSIQTIFFKCWYVCFL